MMPWFCENPYLFISYSLKEQEAEGLRACLSSLSLPFPLLSGSFLTFLTLRSSRKKRRNPWVSVEVPLKIHFFLLIPFVRNAEVSVCLGTGNNEHLELLAFHRVAGWG